MVLGVPIKLLNETLNFVVTVELTSGQTYRGKLLEVEDNMNLQLADVKVTQRDGSVQAMDQVFLRGNSVRFVIVPDNFRSAPFIESFGKKKPVNVPIVNVGGGRSFGGRGGRGMRGGSTFTVLS